MALNVKIVLVMILKLHKNLSFKILLIIKKFHFNYIFKKEFYEKNQQRNESTPSPYRDTGQLSIFMTSVFFINVPKKSPNNLNPLTFDLVKNYFTSYFYFQRPNSLLLIYS